MNDFEKVQKAQTELKALSEERDSKDKELTGLRKKVWDVLGSPPGVSFNARDLPVNWIAVGIAGAAGFMVGTMSWTVLAALALGTAGLIAYKWYGK